MAGWLPDQIRSRLWMNMALISQISTQTTASSNIFFVTLRCLFYSQKFILDD
jgi:hypothetical protein